ncbi:MAG: glutamate--tRNA ligase [Alphaproteobacteria bacterium]
MTVVTRFAPSPTGMLHIGGARTALFNMLYARHFGGRFVLRIEDTDRARSTEEAKTAIVEGLSWLGIAWDGDVIFQSTRQERHRQAAEDLLARGLAYRCYCTPEELDQMRQAARAAGQAPRYDGRWRDRDPADAPSGIAPTIRLKAPREGETVLSDMVQGEVRVANSEMDDLVLLRGDGSPTYMLSVVVDDHDMGVTHVLRGDDHLTNAFRQIHIFQALGYDLPVFGHVPLIHGADGAKLSKRHGALGVDEYRQMGYLPEALCNYLLRLGWSHGDDEVISLADAIAWFDGSGIGRSPARFDYTKLGHLNGLYIRQSDDARLVDLIRPGLEAALSRPLDDSDLRRLTAGMDGLKQRARTLVDLAQAAAIYCLHRPLPVDDQARPLLAADGRAHLRVLRQALAADGVLWQRDKLEALVRDLALSGGHKLGLFAQPLRAAVTGRTTSPPIFEVMEILGPDETLGRLDDALAPHT